MSNSKCLLESHWKLCDKAADSCCSGVNLISYLCSTNSKITEVDVLCSRSLFVSIRPLGTVVADKKHIYLTSAWINTSDPDLQGTVGVREQSFWWQKIHLQRLHLETTTNVVSLYDPALHLNVLPCFLGNLTWGFNAVNECLHLVVTFGLIGVEVGTSTNDASAPVPELPMGLVLLLTVISFWRDTKVSAVWVTIIDPDPVVFLSWTYFHWCKNLNFNRIIKLNNN